MTEEQQVLLPYIKMRMIDICLSKARNGIHPAGADRIEILQNIQNDTKACMAELSNSDGCESFRTINSAMLAIKTD